MKPGIDWGQRLMAVVWPAFMAACVLELMVFAVADPLDMHWGGTPLGLSRQAVYAIAFFAFWAVATAACGSTILLRMTSDEING